MLRLQLPECVRAIYAEMTHNGNETTMADTALATGNGLAIVLGGISAALVSICITAFCIWVWGGGSSSSEEAAVAAVRDDQNANTRIGLSGKAIESIPKVSYKALVEMSPRDEENPQELCCPICLSEFQGSDDGIRLIPGCSHSFHGDCIRRWLSAQASCPVCRVRIKDPFYEEP